MTDQLLVTDCRVFQLMLIVAVCSVYMQFFCTANMGQTNQ